MDSRVKALAAVAVAISLGASGCGGDGGNDGGGNGGGGGGSRATPEGRQIFTAQGCANCHTLSAANAQGTVGPNLDETLPNKERAYIRESIVNPDATVASGFSADVMPENYGQRLNRQQLDALVDFLARTAGK